MPLEFSVLIGLGAVVVCLLKGRYWWALGVLAALTISVVVVVATAGEIEQDLVSVLLVMVVPLVVSAGAVWLAFRPPRPGSYWDRIRSIDASGESRISTESGLRRFGRSVIGAFVGTVPAVAFMTVAIVVADTSDETQLAFAGIPFLFIGFIVGGAIGFYWVPRAPRRAPSDPSAPLPS
jgi:hypothetical protein